MINYENNLINDTHEKEYESIKNTIKTGDILQLSKISKMFPCNLKIQSAIVKRYIIEEMYDRAIYICENFEDCTVMQSQLITIYNKLKLYDKAIEICNKFPTNERIQSQLIYSYIKLNKLDKALEICKKFETNSVIQAQFSKIINYKEILENQNLQKQYNISFNKEEDKDNNSKLVEIREKLASATIEKEDIKLLDGLESKIDVNMYKFILIAIYHRLGLNKTALQVLKTIDQDYNKYKVLLYNSLTNKKNTFYNLGLYDEIINWQLLDSNKEIKQKIYKNNKY